MLRPTNGASPLAIVPGLILPNARDDLARLSGETSFLLCQPRDGCHVDAETLIVLRGNAGRALVEYRFVYIRGYELHFPDKYLGLLAINRDRVLSGMQKIVMKRRVVRKLLSWVEVTPGFLSMTNVRRVITREDDRGGIPWQRKLV